MLHDRIRFSAGKHSIDVHIESADRAVANSTRYRERSEPYSEPSAEVRRWYLGRAEELLRMINVDEERYLTNLRNPAGGELAEQALALAHGSRGLSIALGAREETRAVAARFDFVAQRASELLSTIYSYEPDLREVN